MAFTFLTLFFLNNVLAQTSIENISEEILKAQIITFSSQDVKTTIDLNKGIILVSSPLTCKPCILEMATHFKIPVVFLLDKELKGARAWHNYLKSNNLKNECYIIAYQEEVVLASPMLLFCHEGKIYNESYNAIFDISDKRKKIKMLKKKLNI
jgi:hypothetical protein